MVVLLILHFISNPLASYTRTYICVYVYSIYMCVCIYIFDIYIVYLMCCHLLLLTELELFLPAAFSQGFFLLLSVLL